MSWVKCNLLLFHGCLRAECFRQQCTSILEARYLGLRPRIGTLLTTDLTTGKLACAWETPRLGSHSEPLRSHLEATIWGPWVQIARPVRLRQGLRLLQMHRRRWTCQSSRWFAHSRCSLACGPTYQIRRTKPASLTCIWRHWCGSLPTRPWKLSSDLLSGWGS